jgi:serine/threonine protein kinase
MGLLQIICWELFTGKPFYGRMASFEMVFDILVGSGQLPTEMPLPPETRQKLGGSVFRVSLMKTLNRNPADRPSVDDLVKNWTSIFQSTQS